MNHVDTNVTRGHPLKDVSRSIRRSVVNGKQLKVLKRLSLQAFNGTANIRINVIGGHNDRNPWFIEGHTGHALSELHPTHSKAA
jgi:hypothetical protein